MANKKKIILLVSLLGLIAIIQLISNGRPIYDNIFHYNYVKGVRQLQWINFGLGLLSIFYLISIRRKLYKGRTIYVLTVLLLLNAVFIFIHLFSFFSQDMF